MRNYSLTHLRDAVLVQRLGMLAARDREITAVLLAHIAEVDDRGLYRPAYASMFAYCVEHLHLSEGAAYKRIHAARACRRFPELFTALAKGRVHLAAVCLLAPHFTRENLEELLKAATHRSKSEIDELIAARFSPPSSPASLRPMIRPVAPAPPTPMQNGDAGFAGDLLAPDAQPAPVPSNPQDYGQLPPAAVEGTQVQSLSQNCPVFLVRLTVPKSTRDKLQYAQALLSHAVGPDDLAQVLDRALDALISQLEVRRFGANTRNLARDEERVRERDAAVRHIPASIRRAVWERDKGRCTHISITGGRCRVRHHLQIDHVVPLARGGKPLVENLRLRCSSHNQFDAERVFGVDFMRQKRRDSFAEGAGEPHHEDST